MKARCTPAREPASWPLARGAAATTLASGEFIQAASLGGAGTFRVNYSGTGKDLLYAGDIIDTAKLDVQGSDKLVLTGANTSTAA